MADEGRSQGDSSPLRVRPLPGAGLVVRLESLLAVVGPGGSATAVRELLELLERLAAQPADTNMSRALMSHLATADESSTPALGVLQLGTEGLGVLLYGAMECRVHTPAGEHALTGRNAALCIDVMIPEPFDVAALIVEGVEAGEGHPHARLDRGIVEGGGAIVGGSGSGPAQSAAGTADGDVAAAPVVDGVECPSGHFNHPFALACSVCGTSLVANTRRATRGPRPSLGTVALEDGSRYPLVHDYVIGREPAHDPSVASGQSRPLAVEDPEHLVSRVHAEIRLVDWTVEIVDRGSSNGVHILTPESSDWHRVDADAAVAISPGTQIQIGRKTLIYEADQ